MWTIPGLPKLGDYMSAAEAEALIVCCLNALEDATDTVDDDPELELPPTAVASLREHAESRPVWRRYFEIVDAAEMPRPTEDGSHTAAPGNWLSGLRLVLMAVGIPLWLAAEPGAADRISSIVGSVLPEPHPLNQALKSVQRS